MQNHDQKGLLEKAFLKIRALKQQLSEVSSAKQEPIAIVGMACRFPGDSDTPEAFWKMLEQGRNCVSEIPADRWNIDKWYDSDPEAPGKMYTRYGAFLKNTDLFDPQFFGISPREAISLDPQQRLLLEVSWQAFENAGISPEKLKKSRTGIYTGLFMSDYGQQSFWNNPPTQIDSHNKLGSLRGMSAGRLAYFLDVHGPVMQLDTACSSSLLGIHLASQSLRSGESDISLAGGVNLMYSPEVYVSLCKMKALSPDANCNSFDSGANGYVRGEGCGMIVLKRLSDAEKSGDRILALLRGSAVNHDGRSNGLTAPNGLAQEALIQEAIQNAQVDPTKIQMVEAHGTGTPLGDPIEALALANTLCKGRDKNNKLYLTTVKTNIGHLESAAGMPSVIKAILCIQNKAIPPHLHLKEKNPRIPWQDLPIEINDSITPWPHQEGGRLASINSFGMTGTNTHLVLQEYEGTNSPQVDHAPSNPERASHLLNISAKSPKALLDYASLYEEFLENISQSKIQNIDLANICFSANTGRGNFSHRLSIIADNPKDALTQLTHFREGQSSPKVISDLHTKQNPKVAFLFTGQGSQAIGMGRQLFDEHPLFRESMQECEGILREYLEHPLLEVIYSDKHGADLLHQTAYTQPALFAIEISLSRLLLSWGITPHSVTGHSVGEYAAAYIAGVFSLKDGLKLIAARGRLIQSLPKGGAMLAVMASESKLEAILNSSRGISLAAINGPESLVLSGPTEELNQVASTLRKKNIKNTLLLVSHAFHSSLMDPILDEFEKIASTVTFKKPQLNFYSNVSGRLVSNEICHASYWREHIRQPVKFYEGLKSLSKDQHNFFIEVGPKPILSAMGQLCIEDDSLVWSPCLVPGQSDWHSLLKTVAHCHQHGLTVDFEAFDKPYPRKKESIPNYPFQRSSYWVESTPKLSVVPKLHSPSGHPILGEKLNLGESHESRFHASISTQELPFLKDHQVYGKIVLPASAYIDMVLSAVRESSDVSSEQTLSLKNIQLQEALILSEQNASTVQTVLNKISSSEYTFKCISLKDDSTWRRHAQGEVFIGVPKGIPASQQYQTLVAGFSEEVNPEEWYPAWSQSKGIHYGKSFQAMSRLFRKANASLGIIRMPLKKEGYQIHPILLDAAFQVSSLALPHDDDNTYIPVGFKEFHQHSSISQGELWVYAELSESAKKQSNFIEINMGIYEGSKLVISIVGLKVQRISKETLKAQTSGDWQDMLFTQVWKQSFLHSSSPSFFLNLKEVQTKSTSKNDSLLKEIQFYHKLKPKMDEASIGFIVQALTDLGFQWIKGSVHQKEELFAQLGITPTYKKWFDRILFHLSEVGLVDLRENLVEILSVLKTEAIEATQEELIKITPQDEYILGLVHRCGKNLSRVLCGKDDPLQTILPKEEIQKYAQIYQQSPLMKNMGLILAEAIQQILSTIPKNQKIRILEIGGGTGGVTSKILPLFDPKRTEYVFTDVSSVFTTEAKKTFAAYTFLETRVLDIEKSPSEQDYDEQDFDIIIAANVLHATKDLKKSLRLADSLLAPEGILVLQETVEAQPWLDITFGLTEGWWRYEDSELRPTCALLSHPSWSQLLTDLNLIEFQTLPQSEDSVLGQSIILAKKAALKKPITKNWLIFADQSGYAEELSKKLKHLGHSSTLVQHGAEFKQIQQNSYEINPENPSDFEQLLHHIPIDKQADTVVYMWGLDATQSGNLKPELFEESNRLCTSSCLHLVQSLLKKEIEKAFQFCVVTGCSLSVIASDQIEGLAQSTLWGLGKVINLEYPELNTRLIDIDTNDLVQNSTEGLLSELLHGKGEDKIAERQGKRYAPRIQPDSIELGKHSDHFSLSLSSSFLITGGLGGLGLLTAEWLTHRGASQLILLSRRAPNEETQKRISEIESMGVSILCKQGDVTNFEELETVFSEIKNSCPPLKGIFHEAGTVNDRSLIQMDLDRFNQVLGPKQTGTWNLHLLSQNLKLDHFVCFSSLASFLGSSGQSNHAAANSFLDAFSAFRHAIGLPCLSINWGLWAEIGKVSSMGEREKKRISAMGIDQIKPHEGLLAMSHLMQSDSVQTAVSPIHWNQFLKRYPTDKVPAIYHDVASPRESPSANQTGSESSDPIKLIEQIEEAAFSEKTKVLENGIRQLVAQVLGVEETLDDHLGFAEMGMDSMLSLDLRNKLQTSLSCTLPATLTFKYPNLSALIEHIKKDVAGHCFKEKGSASQEEPPLSSDNPTSEEDALDDLSEDEMAAELARTIASLT